VKHACIWCAHKNSVFRGAHILGVRLPGQRYFLLCHLTLAGSHFSIFFMSSSCHLKVLGDCRFVEYLCTPCSISQSTLVIVTYYVGCLLFKVYFLYMIFYELALHIVDCHIGRYFILVKLI